MYVDPADVDELAWREALVRGGGPDNPDRLWPVLATGMGDLLQREAAQRAALDEHAARLEMVARGTRELASRQRTVLHQRLEAIKRREVHMATTDGHALSTVWACVPEVGDGLMTPVRLSNADAVSSGSPTHLRV